MAPLQEQLRVIAPLPENHLLAVLGCGASRLDERGRFPLAVL
jgi:UDP-N-acetylmuramyl tripeptide synthase